MPEFDCDTITDGQIRSLQSGAEIAGRDMLAKICMAATIAPDPIRAIARQLCADAINRGDLAQRQQPVEGARAIPSCGSCAGTGRRGGGGGGGGGVGGGGGGGKLCTRCAGTGLE